MTITTADERKPTAGRPAGRWALFGLCVGGFALRLSGFVLLGVLIASIATIVVRVGLLLTIGGLALLRGSAGIERRIAGRVLGAAIGNPHPLAISGGPPSRLRQRLADPATWREVLWLLESQTVGFALHLAALVGYVLLPVGYWVSPWLLRMDAAIARTLLEPREAQLQERISSLETSRARSVDHSAAELRRIERDLHDGAQARLVAAGLDIGLAESLMDAQPDKARDLLAHARGTTRDALADLRNLVRGIHPPVLADRGLPGGIESLALSSSIPVIVDGSLAGRPPQPLEAAFYFGIAEAITNATKHAGAQSISIWIAYIVDALHVQIVDDGVGGAVVCPGGGLAGIASRLETFDGTLSVTSPHGGPTVVTMIAPCALTYLPAEPKRRNTFR